MVSVKSMIKLGLVGAFLSMGFSGCSAMHTAVKKRNLDVQTKMSETVFLEPVAPSKRVVFVDIRNTSDKELHIIEGIRNKLQQRGYTITDNPDSANYMLQANVLQVAKSDLRTASNALQSGFGGAIVGGAIGGTVGGSHSGSSLDFSSKGALIGSAVGGLVSFVGDAMVDDVLYVMVTDLQLKERPAEGEVIEQTQNTSATSGTATKVNQVVSGGNAKWKIYRTRIVSTANKVNLDFEEAKTILEGNLVKSIGGIF